MTSASELNGHATGLWLEEAATPYYMYKENGIKVILASPAGGPVPLDQNGLAGDFLTDDCKRFLHDAEAVGALSHTVKVSNVDFDKADAIFMAGGHGTCADFVSNPALKAAVESTYAANKIVSAVCHGVNILAECCLTDGATPMLKDKVCTGFSDSEEKAVQLEGLVPFLIETRFKELGAKYESGGDWSSKVCVDGNLITGQNPQSSRACAAAVIAALA
jgi:putative intracellular protease/amidase